MPAVVPIFAIVVGLVLVVIGLAHPGFLWESSKVAAGRDALGDGGMSAVFVSFGLVFCGVAGLALKRRG